MNLVDLLQLSGRTALVTVQGQTVGYAELRRRVEAFAGGLFDLGVRAGDRFVLAMPMGGELVVGLLGLLRVGATAVLVDPPLSELSADVGPLLERLRPVGLIGAPAAHLLRLRWPALRGLGLYVSTGFTPLPHRRFERVVGKAAPADDGSAPALMTVTTGTARCVAHSHANLLARHHALSEHMDVGPGDVDLPTRPDLLLHSLASGATCVLADQRHSGRVDGARLINWIRARRVTTMSASPALFQQVLERLEATGERLDGLRAVFTWGAGIPAEVPAGLLRGLCERLPGARVCVLYGSSEAEPIAVLDVRADLDALVDGERHARGALVGRPVADISLRIAGGDVGEVEVAGGHVAPGTWDDPAADAGHDGDRVWHRTGDVGRLDTDGRLWLLGRVGEQVAGRWPLPVERAAELLPFVRRAGLVSVEGEAVLCCELSDPPPDWDARVEDTTGLVPVAVPEVPVDSRNEGRIDRRALLALLTS